MREVRARSRLPEALVRLGFAWPRTVLALWALLAGLGTFGINRLEVETSTDSVLNRSDSAWEFYQASQERFGGDEILTVLIEAPRPFDPTVLTEILRLSEVFQDVDGVWRVDSLATVPLVHSTAEGDVSLEAALHEGVPTSSDELAALAVRVWRDRIAPRNLLSSDGRFFAVNLVLQKAAESHYEEILARVERELEGQRFWVSGVPIFRMEADSRTRSELAVFVPLTVLLVGGLLYGLFRCLGAVVIPLATSGVGSWIVLATMGALGCPLTISTVVLPSVLLALGSAYCMHLLAAVVGQKGEEELRQSLLSVALPVALSGLTTAVGFVAVSFVRIETIRDVGAFGALGVLVVLAATLTAAPATLRLWPLATVRLSFQAWLSGEAAARLMDFVNRRWRIIVAGWAIALGAVTVGIWQIQVETDVVVWFSCQDPIRVAYDQIRKQLSGISPMNVVVEAPNGASVASPEVVLAIGGLTDHLEAQVEVGRAVSIADPLRQIHGCFIGDSRNPLPGTRELISQYLLLLESKDYTHDLISTGRDATNVLLRVDDNGSMALLGVARKAHDWWANHGVEGYSATTTGIMYEFARAEDAISKGQLRGLCFAFLAIGTILMAIFRWGRLAAIALVPNAVPVAMAFGIMGLFGVALDAGTVVLGNLAFGIAVDNTIHVVTGFYRRYEQGAPPRVALAVAFRRVLPPLVFTTIAVALGFVVLGVSDFTVTRHLGLLTAGIVVLCLLADVLLLPALLLHIGGRDLLAESGGLGGDTTGPGVEKSYLK